MVKARQILPESHMCHTASLPDNRAPRLLSAMAIGQTLQAAFSGITYHLACAGLSTLKLEGCFSLYSGSTPQPRLHIRGGLWKLNRILRGQKTQGFKFTSDCVDAVWPRYIESLAGTTLISNFQLYGREFFKRRKLLDIGAYYYIDGTLTDYFDSYAEYDMANVDRCTMKQAIEVEQEGYHCADGIVTMSKLSARTLTERYGVPREKISVVVPGANLPDPISPDPLLPAETKDFVLGFVGLYPIRKGLDRLAGAMQILRARGLPIRLRVIGNCPDELKKLDGLDYLGVISKRNDLPAFLTAIKDVHLGCLLSRSELAGIAMLEFLRLGIPILGTRVGGAVDILEGGGSICVSPEVTPDELAEVIAGVYEDRPGYMALRTQATARSAWADWKRAANELDAVLP